MYLIPSAIIILFINQSVAEESCKIKNDIKDRDNLIDSDLENEKSDFFETRNTIVGNEYFEYYSNLKAHSGMLRDQTRNAAYQKAMLDNLSDFAGKIILDFGTGTGVMASFALQAGAKRVYAVDNSNAAYVAKVILSSTFGEENVELVEVGEAKNDGEKKRVRIIKGKVEEIGRNEVPEDIDLLLSETMGFMLYSERALESYVHAKKFFGKNKVKMFPSKGDLHFAPFTDKAMYDAQIARAKFWKTTDFYGLNISGIYEHALNQAFEHTFSGPQISNSLTLPHVIMAPSNRHRMDFETALETDLHRMAMPFEFKLTKGGTIHGLTFWFDVGFFGTDNTRWLSTAPWETMTPWYQTSCLVKTPLNAKKGDTLTGQVVMRIHENLSYYVDIDMQLETTVTKPDGSLETVTKHAHNYNIDLKEPDKSPYY